MAMEITSNYNAYESTYAAQKQETAKNQAASGKETLETVVAQKKIHCRKWQGKKYYRLCEEIGKTCSKRRF